jgi:drug/metabolite transporter (DMT)-like permease
MTLTSIGLLMATATSVSNVFVDVARKKILDSQDVISTNFLCKVAATFFYTFAIIYLLSNNTPLIKFNFGQDSKTIYFLLYLFMNTALEATALLLYLKALQVSPLSMCTPFLAFTPIFLIPTGAIMIGELPTYPKLLGVVMIVIGSLAMHRKLFALGWAEPIKALIRERGSRYMMIVACIFSLTNPLDKQLVTMSHAFTLAALKGIIYVLFFGSLIMIKRLDWRRVWTSAPKWIVITGALEAIVLLLQFTSHNYIDVVITISLKRAGIVLAVLMGWLIFKERDIQDKLIASCVMVTGALMFYIPISLGAAALLALAVVIGMFVFFFFTPEKQKVELKPEPAQVDS